LEVTLKEKGKEALTLLNLPMMNPELVRTIGQFYLRYSYGQNLWIHSLEVAKICENLAIELELDPVLAKKAGLLHDIGKVLAGAGESHTKIGADMLRKQSMDPIIINAAESHHYDVEMTSPYSWLVAAADAMSASRPGARFDTKEFFIEKMGELEKLILEVE
jgi:2',3'-cyclic-nucleotide 2'-phosphodiesterase